MDYIFLSRFFLPVVFLCVVYIVRFCCIDTVVVLLTTFLLPNQKKSLFCILSRSTALAPYLTAINFNGSRNASSLIISNLIPFSLVWMCERINREYARVRAFIPLMRVRPLTALMQGTSIFFHALFK